MTGLYEVRPPSPGRNRKNGLSIREYVTNCPACHWAIFRGDDVVRIKRPVTGLVHRACVPKEAEG